MWSVTVITSAVAALRAAKSLATNIRTARTTLPRWLTKPKTGDFGLARRGGQTLCDDSQLRVHYGELVVVNVNGDTQPSDNLRWGL